MKKRRGKRNTDMIDPKVLAAYDRWVTKHFDELVRKYAGKYIAVYRNKLVAVGNSYKEVYDTAVKQGIEEPPLTMQVPGIEDLETILALESHGWLLTRARRAVPPLGTRRYI